MVAPFLALRDLINNVSEQMAAARVNGEGTLAAMSLIVLKDMSQQGRCVPCLSTLQMC